MRLVTPMVRQVEDFVPSRPKLKENAGPGLETNGLDIEPPACGEWEQRWGSLSWEEEK